MNASIRLATMATIVALVALGVAACTDATGPLGTPASPVVSQPASDGPSPSDVAPGSPTAASTVAPAGTPSEKPASARPAASPSPTARPAATPSPSPSGTTIVRAYFMLGSFTDNAGLVPVLREVPKTTAVARAAMNALLAGPHGAELAASPAMYTSIPDGTRLLDIAIADKVATVLLSREWIAVDGSQQGEVATAQVVYTLTQFATVDEVRIQVKGESPRMPVGRSDFQTLGILPAIFVDRPAWGAAGGNPMRVSGIANVFEATFRAQVLDAKDKVLVDKQVTASCGTGCWGSFRTDLAYAIAKAQYGTLRVFDLSARDGTPENVTEYRIWLTP